MAGRSVQGCATDAKPRCAAVHGGFGAHVSFTEEVVVPSPPGERATKRRPSTRTLEELRPYVRDGHYRLGSHATRHALAEGFTEIDVVMTLLHGRTLARDPLDQRLLVLGWLPAGRQVRLPLHVVVEYIKPRWVDVVTAFIPRDPHRVVSRQRLAEILRAEDAAQEGSAKPPRAPKATRTR